MSIDIHAPIDPPESDTVRVFASQLHAGHIGHLIRFYAGNPQRETIAVMTAELRQINHTGSETTVYVGIGAEHEHMMNSDDRVIINPRRDYSDVPLMLGNDPFCSRRPRAVTVTDERNIPMSTASLPEGWTWRSTSVVHADTILASTGTVEGSTTITAVFDVDPGTLPDIPGPLQSFRPTVVFAQWITDGTAYDPDATLAQIELDGPHVNARGELLAARRTRGSYRAFRNEIALARSGGPAAESSQLTQAAVNALDGWAAHKGLPAVHVEIGDRA